MIKNGDNVKFTMPKEVYDMIHPTNPNLQQVSIGIAVGDEFTVANRQVVVVNIDGEVTTLETKDLEVINV